MACLTLVVRSCTPSGFLPTGKKEHGFLEKAYHPRCRVSAYILSYVEIEDG